MRVRAAISSHRYVVATVLAILAGLTAFVLAYFEPQKLFINDRVSEPPPGLPAGGPETAAAAPGIDTLSSAAFTSYEHHTRGRALILRVRDGRRFLRFEDFRTSNGPDVRVYLSAAAAGGPGDRFDDDYVELGHLKGNIGSQNYRIPASLDLGRYRSAVVWCKRFSVAFGAAAVVGGR
jgi:hypothetical protein